MDIIFYTAIFVGLIAVVYLNFTIGFASLAVGWFGPVAYRFYLTGDDSLVWELAFRTAIVVILVLVANQLLPPLDDSKNSTKQG